MKMAAGNTTYLSLAFFSALLLTSYFRLVTAPAEQEVQSSIFISPTESDGVNRVQVIQLDVKSKPLATDPSLSKSANTQLIRVAVDNLYAPFAIHISSSQQLITEPGLHTFAVNQTSNRNYRVELIDPYSTQQCNIPVPSQTVHESADVTVEIDCIKNENQIAYYNW